VYKIVINSEQYQFNNMTKHNISLPFIIINPFCVDEKLGCVDKDKLFIGYSQK
jgi:hypothetical protein